MRTNFREIRVLDQGFVRLLEVMGSDADIVASARISYLGESRSDADDKRLLFDLVRKGHMSPFEQAVMRCQIRLPVVVAWQLVRHRTASLNSQSGRYVAFEPNDFYVPEWRGKIEGELPDIEQHYAHCFGLYQQALDAGVVKEQARLFLPFAAMYYTWVWRMDVRNMMNMFHQRLAPGAQWEIRQYATALFTLFEEQFPWTAEAFRKYIGGTHLDTERNQ